MDISTVNTGFGGPSLLTLMAIKHFAEVPNNQLIRHVHKSAEFLNRLPETSIFDSFYDGMVKVAQLKRFLSDAGDKVAALERKWYDIDHCVWRVELVAKDVKADTKDLKKRADLVKKVLTRELTRDQLLVVMGEIMSIFGDFGDIKEQLEQIKTRFETCRGQILDFQKMCKEESARAKKWRMAGGAGAAIGILAAVAPPVGLPVAAATATVMQASGAAVAAGGAYVFIEYHGLIQYTDGIVLCLQDDIKKLNPLSEHLHKLQRQHAKHMKEVKQAKQFVEMMEPAH